MNHQIASYTAALFMKNWWVQQAVWSSRILVDLSQKNPEDVLSTLLGLHTAHPSHLAPVYMGAYQPRRENGRLGLPAMDHSHCWAFRNVSWWGWSFWSTEFPSRMKRMLIMGLLILDYNWVPFRSARLFWYPNITPHALPNFSLNHSGPAAGFRMSPTFF